MGRTNREGLAWKSAVVAVVFLVLLTIGWVFDGSTSAVVWAIAISTAVAIAVFYGGTRRDCSPHVPRRRER